MGALTQRGARSDRSPRKAVRWARVLLALFAAALAFAAAEAVVRLLRSPLSLQRQSIPSIYRFSPNPDLVFDLVPDSQVSLPESYGPVDYRVNSLGMRGGEVAVPKPAGVFRILALGDSVTFGLWLTEEDTVSARLGRALAHREGSVVRSEVLNGGVPGYNTHQELASLKERGLALEPDLVLVNFSQNDILPPTVTASFEAITRPVPLSPHLFADPSRAQPAILPPAEPPSSHDQPRSWLKEHVQLYALLALRWNDLVVAFGARPAPRDPELPWPWSSPWQDALNDPGSVEWEWLRQRYLAMRDLLIPRGAALVIWLALPTNLNSEFEQMRSSFANFGAENGIAIVDTASLVSSHPDPPSLFLPAEHLSAAGSQLVAEALLGALLERRLLP